MNKKSIKDRIEKIISSRTDNVDKNLNNKKIHSEIEKNIELIEDIIGSSDDIIIRKFTLGKNPSIKAALCFADGLIDKKVINTNILWPLLNKNFFKKKGKNEIRERDIIKFLEKNIITINELEVVNDFKKMIQAPLNGDSILLVDGFEQVFVLNTKGWELRGISEPETESVIRGARDGFTETLRINTAMIRRRVKHPALRIKNMNAGKFSKTDIAICYIEGLTNKYLVEEVKERVSNIDIDSIQESGFIEQLIEDSPFSLFPQILSTERPDRVVSNLIEGRIAIVTDSTPLVLIVPVTFSVFLQSPEDYYDRFIIGSFLRALRFIAIIIALTLPSIYIAIIAFHPEMIPTRLALAFAGARAAVPFPSYIEAFIMTALMELLREGSIRLPNPIGPTIGIVGALIIGDAAVSASIVSPFMVIIVATTTIASFAIPDYSAAIALRLAKIPLMILSSIFGLYGLVIGLILLSIHLVSLKSFGIPYMTPIAPSRISDLKDAVFRVPTWSMVNRPKHMRTKNKQRFNSKGDDDGNERTR